MNKIGDFEKQMTAAFEKHDEKEKFRNMSSAEKEQLRATEIHEEQVQRRYVERHGTAWRVKNKKKKKTAKISRRSNRK
tara:strand:+ start:493 stop:726 length:234 start_codon:yes stop_codon:yes gene_type:complete